MRSRRLGTRRERHGPQRWRQELFLPFFFVAQFEFQFQPQFQLKRGLGHGRQFHQELKRRWKQNLQFREWQKLQLRLDLG